MPNADSVAFLFVTDKLTDEQIERVRAFINREIASQLKVSTGYVCWMRFDSSAGDVVIHQP